MGKISEIVKQAVFEAEESNFSKVGDVVSSMFTEIQFQTERDGTWVLMDGRDVTGSDYHTLTASANIPDARGRFLRGKSHTSGNNPDGDLVLGQYQADQFYSHNHSVNVGSYTGPVNDDPNGWEADYEGGSSTGYSGGNETRNKNITINYFIKINEAE